MTRAWRETVVIPTYRPGKPERNPVFLEKRVYQGSSGVVYPYPVIESIADGKSDVEYNAVYLENEYIKVMILPELGGRVQMAYDKIAGRHFIYYNRTIKPALVGLAGPWISGGIEFNWPQHHRPSTFMEVDSDIVENPDGSVTVLISEAERMFHQKSTAGFTLYPGKAYLEITGRLYNPTPMPQTFLWWANPAVKVNDFYQSVFPGDVNAVFDHGKRAVSSFPIATGTYYNMDYSAGVDISNYRNIKVPTSYMAINSKYDFEGGWENDTRAGMLHVADHHFSPGKKQWTWGNGDFGRAWDRNLTDEDGPYIELMAGVFTENQPDFSWLQPYEEKNFVQYFLPYRELGLVKNASKDILMNIEPCPEGALLKLFATSAMEVEVTLTSDGGDVLMDSRVALTPESVFSTVVNGAEAGKVTVRIHEGDLTLLEWHAESSEVRPLPDPAVAALQPQQIKTCEQLYLTGLHLEQYRHANFQPMDYYMEALRRDPDDVRCNNAVGLWYIRHGRFVLAEEYLRRAFKVLTVRNPNPYDGEPLFNLGLSLYYQGRFDEAYDMFYKSTWNGAWQDAGFLWCARISAMRGRLADALREVDLSLVRNWHNYSARGLKAAVLCMSGCREKALRFIDESLEIDPFNFVCLWERALLTGAAQDSERFFSMMRTDAHNFHELAVEYALAGLWERGADILEKTVARTEATPMTFYYLGWCLKSAGRMEDAMKAFSQGAGVCPDCCFPNRLEAILALECAKELAREDARAPYLLGNIFYDKRQYDLAVENWELSTRLDDSFPTVWRNLSLAYYNKRGDSDAAVAALERAFSLDTSDSRVFMELDQLYKKQQYPYSTRLENFIAYPALVESRDDLVLEKATLLNQLGRWEEAMAIIDSHVFHPWEGGEGKVTAQYQFCRTELAKAALLEGHPEDALRLLRECTEYPESLGEGKLYGAKENDFFYLMGRAADMMGDSALAQECWTKASQGDMQPAAAIYYNDAKPEKIFYKGLALRSIGQEGKANGCFHSLVNYGEKHLFDKVIMDYFAVSLPDLLIWDGDLTRSNEIHCKFMMALGHYGLGNRERADALIRELSLMDVNHQGIMSVRSLVPVLDI